MVSETSAEHMTALNYDDADRLVAAPGWVICQRMIAPNETKSKGGILVPTNAEKNVALMGWARIHSCGAYYDARSGDAYPECQKPAIQWPLPKGTLICFHPHSPWQIGNIEGRDLIVLKSCDVIGVLDK